MNQQNASTVLESAETVQLNQLEVRLQEKLSGRVNDLRLLRHNRGLILRGVARTFYAKQLAQHAVMTETRLPILANEIEVY